MACNSSRVYKRQKITSMGKRLFRVTVFFDPLWGAFLVVELRNFAKAHFSNNLCRLGAVLFAIATNLLSGKLILFGGAIKVGYRSPHPFLGFVKLPYF